MAAEEPGSGARIPLGRLPAGRHGLPRELVAANHRERLIAACIQAISADGYADVTVADVIKLAAVSRRTFYEYFDSKESCFLASYDLVVSHLRALVKGGFEKENEWPLQVRAALRAVLGFFSEEPQLARLCMVEPLAAGRPIADHHRAEVESFAPLLQPGRRLSGAKELPPDTEEAVIAGIASLITMRVVAGQAEQLEQLLPVLVETALTPFLGAAEAERIARE